MIGNDVIDLQSAALESNWKRKGYLDKLFCKEERNSIFDSPDPNRMVWLLWSMKEAGYKIYFREKLVRTYQPKNIICSNLFIDGNSARGQIYYNGQKYFSRSILNTDFIHTTAVIHSSLFNNLQLIIEKNRGAHNRLTGHYQECTYENTFLGYTVIKSGQNVPYLLNEATDERHSLSISHHGRFVSWAFISNNNLV